METIFADMQNNGTTFDTNPHSRLPSRPHGSQPVKPNSSLFHDSGSTLRSSRSDDSRKMPKKPDQAQVSRRPKVSSKDHDYVSSDDQLDSLSESSPKKKETSPSLHFIDKDGSKHPYNANFMPRQSQILRTLKFTKNKTLSDHVGTSRSQEPFCEEKSVGARNLSPCIAGYPVPRSEPDTYHPQPLRDKTPGPNRRVSYERPEPIGNSRPRPRPRPIIKRNPHANIQQNQYQDTPQKKGKEGLVPEKASGPGKGKKQRSGNAIKIYSTSGEEGSSGSDYKAKTQVPRKFRIISPPSSRTSDSARRINQISAFPLSPLRHHSSSDERPSPSNKVSKGVNKTKTDDVLSSAQSPKKTAKANARGFPMPSPQSSNKTAQPNFLKSKSKQRAIILDEEDEVVAATPRPCAEPFPMSTQMLHGLDSPTTPSNSRSTSAKRHSGGVVSDKEGSSKKKRRDESVNLSEDHYEDDDSIFISPTTDPRTLCPYCDIPLPSSPTPLLVRLLELTAKKSKPDPRPANPLGRKAPFVTFIAVCQRHRFESRILPEAERKGWPKTIDWHKLESRIAKMQDALQALINDPGDERDGMDDDGWENITKKRGPRSMSIFWCEVMKEVKTKGSRAAASVRGQFANFDKAQPGYYGELGSMIIHQTLCNLFPPSSFDPRLISPMSANEFVLRILVPEVALRLIMEDNKLKDESGLTEALQILRDSSAYGVAMFPEDGGEWGGTEGGRGKKNSDAVAAGDLIVMERARRRRKEIEDEAEKDEPDESERLCLAELEAPKRTAKAKGKKKQGIVDESNTVAPKETPRPRPRPRPIAKATSQMSVNHDAEEDNNPFEKDLGDYDADRRNNTDLSTEPVSDDNDSDSDTSFHYNRHSRSPSASATAPRPSRTQSRISAKSSSRGGSDMDLCSSSESDSRGLRTNSLPKTSQESRNGEEKPQKARSLKSTDVDRSDSDSIVIRSSFSTKNPTRKHKKQDSDVIEIMDDALPTPRPAQKQPTYQKQLPSSSHSALKPLEAARLRRQMKDANRNQLEGQIKQQSVKGSNASGWIYSMRPGPDADNDNAPDLSRSPSRSSKGLQRNNSDFGWLLSENSQSPTGKGRARG